MSRIDIDLGRHGPLHNVALRGKSDDPVLWMEVPRGPVLCLTAAGAEEFALAILRALETAGLRKPPEPLGAAEVTQALLSGMLAIAGDGMAVLEGSRLPRTPAPPTPVVAAPDPPSIVDEFPPGCYVVPANDCAARNMLVKPGFWAIVAGHEATNLVVRWEHSGIVRYHPADWFRRA